MRSKGLMMLVIAVLAGLVAVVMASRWMSRQGYQVTEVAVATGELLPGTKVSGSTVRMVSWPQESIPPGAFTKADAVDGRIVVQPLQRGEPILESRLAPIGAKGGLSAVVPEGKRAITVRVNDVVGVAGFALPGTFVDVMVNTQSDNGSNERERAISKIVLNRILVMAVAQESDRDTTAPKVVNAVTLEVTPDEAEKLDLARSVGTLSLVLRNQLETQTTATRGITKAELLGQEPPRAAAPPPTEPAPVAAAPVRRPVARPVVAAATPVVAVAAPAPVQVAAPAAAPAAPARQPYCVEVIRGLSKVNECF